MPIQVLSVTHPVFQDPRLADHNGIVAVGGNLQVHTLLDAYQRGIFPWYNKDEPILWWSPDPRFVLFPKELKVHKSMRSYFNQGKYTVSYDQAFREVMQSCAEVSRKGQNGTWITDKMLDAYTNLHHLGYAHSVEVWDNEELVGGLYGLSLGKIFFGESMFAKKPNASKFGFISLIQALEKKGFNLIDCQQETKHLASLGARSISRNDFLDFLKRNEAEETIMGNWGEGMI